MSAPARDLDYLVVGSGIAGLVFAALMAKSGRKVVVLEAHEYAGGYGHTFQMGNSARFNAQLHYVWNCGEGQTVNKVLRKLDLAQKISFESLDPDGFDHMVIPNHQVKIPASSTELCKRLSAMFPEHRRSIERFLGTVNRVARGLDTISSGPSLKGFAADGLVTLLD